MTRKPRYDVVIGGGGPTGRAVALALAHEFFGDARIAIVDPSPPDPSPPDPSPPDPSPPDPAAPEADIIDPRAWALSAASVRLLRAIGVWPAVEPDAQPVTAIEITDSALEAGIRPVLLTYDNQTPQGEPAAWIVSNQALLAALTEAVNAHAASISLLPGRSVETFAADPAAITIGLDDGTTLTADLLVAADGRGSRLRQAAGIDCVEWAYRQRGIVTTVRHDRPHGGKAVQHFLPGGPFAMLPLRGNRTSITWSEDAATAARILAMDDQAFLAEIQRRFGGKLGVLALDGPRAGFPLSMHLARTYIAPRFTLVGDAAHGVHPIAGQGLNLAFRDVAVLAECIADGARAGLSFGDATGLERYQARRRFDSLLSASAFDALNRLFSNDEAVLRSAREVGLGLVDRLPPLKRFFVREASGLAGDIPRLMR